MTSPIFSLKTLAVAITSISMASVAGAAALDRSGQDVTAFLQDGTYAEASYTYIDAKVTGHDNAYLGTDDLAKYEKGNKIDDIAEPYGFFRYGVKTDINDTFSVGVLFDEPFGAAAEYNGKNNFVSGGISGDDIIDSLTDKQVNNIRDAGITYAQLKQRAQQEAVAAKTAAEGAVAAQQAGDATKAGELAQKAQEHKATAEQLKEKATQLGSALATANGVEQTRDESTQVEVHSQNITGLLGVKLGADKNLQVYGGPALQRIEGEVALRGPAYLASAGYNARISPDDSLGWVAGVAYSKPEIGLKAALTYRSEIEHKNNISEYSAARDMGQSGKIDITTPESYNLDFQTGINPTTLATAKVRYVPWGDFAIVPPMYNEASKLLYPEGLPLVSYSKDQWQVEVGVAKRLTPALAVSGTVGWDSGAGNPTTSLGPIDGYYSVGAGAKFNLNKNWAISAGGKYLMFGDAKGKLPNNKVVSNFEDNNGYAVGVKLSYQDK